jgi:Alginate lyase
MNAKQPIRAIGFLIVRLFVLSLVVSSCGPGQWLGATLTSTPTFTWTPAFTAMPTLTPEVSPSPTADSPSSSNSFWSGDCASASTGGAGGAFTHPGAVDNKADLDFVKKQIAAGQNPWARLFNELKTLAIGNKSTTAPTTANAQKNNARKAYANALAWYYTGNQTYAENAIGILDVWGTTFIGYPSAEGQDLLQGGWIGALLGPAAEIMRCYPGWEPANMAKVQTMFREKFYPVLNTMSTWNGNVDLTQIDAMMSLAVFNDDKAEFNLGLQRMEARFPAYFYLAADGGVPAIAGDGGDINAFWSKPALWVDGLTQETCRDNNHHAQFALASAMHAAEVAWNQGVDVYGKHSARFVATMELMAKQLLTGDMQGTCVSNSPTPDLYDTWEIGYNHYHNRLGMDLPNTYQLITTQVRQRGINDWNIFYESLTHAGGK